jgi:predicted DNA-binding transcriptional regulator YafY
VLDAIARRHSLRCCYVSPGDSVPLALNLDPYWLLFYLYAWYVVGRSDYHDKVHTFRLSRLKNVFPNNQRFTRPETYSLADYLGNAWGVMPGDATHEVQLRFSPAVGTDVAEIRWHKTQRTVKDSDGSVVFTATVDGLDEVAWWVHGFGNHVEILSPEALRARVAGISSSGGKGCRPQLLGAWG